MSPNEPQVDPNVSWAIEQAVSRAKDEFLNQLRTEMDRSRGEFRSCATCEATHEGVDARIQEARNIAQTADKRVWWAIGTALFATLAALVQIVLFALQVLLVKQ